MKIKIVNKFTGSEKTLKIEAKRIVHFEQKYSKSYNIQKIVK